MSTSPTPQPAVEMHDHNVVVRLVRAAERRTWVERLARFGLVVRGIIYFVPGVFALEWALGRHRQPMSQSSVIDLIGSQPLGRSLLVVVAIGLAGYSAWGVIRAVMDPLQRGRSPAGLAQRAGYAISAIAYMGLFAGTVRLLAYGAPHVAQSQDWTVTLMARPFGGVVVAVIGLCWIFGSGIAQIVFGWRRTFDRDLALDHMGRAERRLATGLGRVGLVSRGIVFTIVGGLIVAAAFHLQPRSSIGLDGALMELARQPFGRTLLGAAGLGLMAFGTFSALCSRWMRMRAPTGARARKPTLHAS